MPRWLAPHLNCGRMVQHRLLDFVVVCFPTPTAVYLLSEGSTFRLRRENRYRCFVNMSKGDVTTLTQTTLTQEDLKIRLEIQWLVTGCSFGSSHVCIVKSF